MQICALSGHAVAYANRRASPAIAAVYHPAVPRLPVSLLVNDDDHRRSSLPLVDVGLSQGLRELLSRDDLRRLNEEEWIYG